MVSPTLEACAELLEVSKQALATLEAFPRTAAIGNGGGLLAIEQLILDLKAAINNIERQD